MGSVYRATKLKKKNILAENYLFHFKATDCSNTHRKSYYMVFKLNLISSARKSNLEDCVHKRSNQDLTNHYRYNCKNIVSRTNTIRTKQQLTVLSHLYYLLFSLLYST